MRRERDRTHLHFLWITSSRKELIERKVAKQRAGRPLANLRHHPQSELSDAELRWRLAWVAQLARALRRPGSDDPPGAAAAPSASTLSVARVPRREPAMTLSIDVDTLLQELLRGEQGPDESSGEDREL